MVDGRELVARFDVERACGDITKEFNASRSLVASEYLVAQAFREYRVLAEGQAICAIRLVDKEWATQLFWGKGADEKLSERYEANRPLVDSWLRELRGTSLECDPQRVQSLGAELLSLLLETPGLERRKPYSFASKFLHCHAPQHLPMVDGRARRAVADLQKQWGLAPGERVDREEDRVHNYGRWISFYSVLIGALTPDERKRLLAADQESPWPQFRRTNSLLRVLDKVFYRRGKPPAKQSKPISPNKE